MGIKEIFYFLHLNYVINMSKLAKKGPISLPLKLLKNFTNIAF